MPLRYDGSLDQIPLEFERLPMPAPLLGERPPMVGQFDRVCRQEDEPPSPEPFGAWLLKQDNRKGWIADLAKAAKTDRGFPKQGTPDDVRKRMQEIGADGDSFEALDAAELDWAAW